MKPKDVPVRGASGKDAPLAIAYIAPQIGALSATFVYRDIEGLRDHGAELTLYSLRRPQQSVTSAEAQEYIEETTYLYDQPLSAFFFAALRQIARRPKAFFRVGGIALRDVVCAKTHSLKGRLTLFWHFLMGCWLTEQLVGGPVAHIHSNFAHAPATIAMYAAGLTGIPFSFMGHAHDLFVHDCAMKEKAARAAFGVCISQYNIRYLREVLQCDTTRIHVLYLGVYPEQFSCRPWRLPEKPLRILSVGRLVEKKGFDVLIAALSRLARDGRSFTADIIGDGPLRASLQQQIGAAALEDSVCLRGGLPQEEVRRYFAQADVFVLACIEAKDKDLDGIPIVIMESMALGTPVITTGVSGIPELVIHKISGYLARPGDPESLAEALAFMMDHPEITEAWVAAARRHIEEHFNLTVNTGKLLEYIRAAAVTD